MQGPEFRTLTPSTVLSVRELALGLRHCVESQYEDVWVEGEISNFKQPASGHCYFTLKDDAAQVRCVLWKSSLRLIFFRPADGMRVRVRGQVTVYEARGDLQLVARTMQPSGEGALQQAFEALKRRLAAEGLFDGSNKRPLPAMPAHIGVVTSGDGAALQDILTVLRRRYPIALVSYRSVRVQGMGAADEIAAAIDAYDAMPEVRRPDVLIVGRGGGSLEDLWAFNEEVVARSTYRCRIPVVSAVGHEVDFSIADFVADVRAATPTMAAELVSPDRLELERRIVHRLHSMRSILQMRIERSRRLVLNVVRSYVFNRPVDRLRQHQRRVDELCERLRRASLAVVRIHIRSRDGLEQRLLLLDPRRPLERGYVAVERAGNRITRAADLHAGDRLKLHFGDGARGARVEEEQRTEVAAVDYQTTASTLDRDERESTVA